MVKKRTSGDRDETRETVVINSLGVFPKQMPVSRNGDREQDRGKKRGRQQQKTGNDKIVGTNTCFN
jgi:hypothetical protein